MGYEDMTTWESRAGMALTANDRGSPELRRKIKTEDVEEVNMEQMTAKYMEAIEDSRLPYVTRAKLKYLYEGGTVPAPMVMGYKRAETEAKEGEIADVYITSMDMEGNPIEIFKFKSGQVAKPEQKIDELERVSFFNNLRASEFMAEEYLSAKYLDANIRTYAKETGEDIAQIYGKYAKIAAKREGERSKEEQQFYKSLAGRAESVTKLFQTWIEAKNELDRPLEQIIKDDAQGKLEIYDNYSEAKENKIRKELKAIDDYVESIADYLRVSSSKHEFDMDAVYNGCKVKLLKGVKPDGEGGGKPIKGEPIIIQDEQGNSKMVSEKDLTDIQVTEKSEARKMADALTVEDVIIYADTFVNKLNESAKQQIRTRKTDYIELLNSISKEAEATVKFINGEIPIDELIQSQVKGLNEREGSTEEQAGQMVDYWSGQLGIEITENKA